MDQPGLLTVLRRGSARRCPVCAKGPIFRNYLHLRRTCGACGWILEREPGTVTGAMYLVSVLTLVFAAAVFFATWLLMDGPSWKKVAVGVPVIALFSLAALPLSRGLWAAIEYYTDIATGEVARDDYAGKAFHKGDASG